MRDTRRFLMTYKFNSGVIMEVVEYGPMELEIIRIRVLSFNLVKPYLDSYLSDNALKLESGCIKIFYITSKQYFRK